MPKPQKAKGQQGKTGQQPISQFSASIILLLLAKKANNVSKAEVAIPAAISSVGFLLCDRGWTDMNSGDGLAPYLLASGSWLVIFAILYTCRESLVRLIRNKWLMWGGCVVICLIIATPAWFLTNYGVNQENERAQNTPTFSCVLEPESGSSNSDTASLRLGTILVKVAPQGSYVLCASSVPFLSIRINKDGHLLLNAVIKDSTNKNIATITNNHVLAYQKYTFWPEQPDEHTFIVNDLEGDDVLHVNFIDPRTIYLTGVFYMKGYSEPVTITDDNMTYPGGGITGGGLIDLSNSSGNVLDFNKDNTVTIMVG